MYFTTLALEGCFISGFNPKKHTPPCCNHRHCTCSFKFQKCYFGVRYFWNLFMEIQNMLGHSKRKPSWYMKRPQINRNPVNMDLDQTASTDPGQAKTNLYSTTKTKIHMKPNKKIRLSAVRRSFWHSLKTWLTFWFPQKGLHSLEIWPECALWLHIIQSLQLGRWSAARRWKQPISWRWLCSILCWIHVQSLSTDGE